MICDYCKKIILEIRCLFAKFFIIMGKECGCDVTGLAEGSTLYQVCVFKNELSNLYFEIGNAMVATIKEVLN